MEGIAPLGTLDPQHAVAQFAKALTDPARAFAFAGPPRLNASIAKLIAGCFRFFSLNQCFDRPA